MKNVTRSLVLVLAATLVGSCQTDRMLAKCPSTGILAETSSMTVFAPGEPMIPANVVYRIDARQAKTDCDIDKDTRTANASLQISFRGYRAKGGGAAEYTVPFFVAVNDTDNKMVMKKTYSTRLAFQPGQTVVDFTQPIDVIPVRIARNKQAYDYHMIVGLLLSKQQLDYNRKTSSYAQ
jgi:hypothetical protein